jgi:hypothetical protein
MFGVGNYKKYIDELTAIFDASNEIIYLCNNFDITRIHNLFINIIETYNYYEDGKNKISDTDLLSEDIRDSLEYKKMKEYIDNNFKKIQDKWNCLLEELQKLKSMLPEFDNQQPDENDDKLIKDNFKSQYKTIRINLEDIERELGKIETITEDSINSIKGDDIQFDIYPITNNSMIFKSGFYVLFKKIFKNLQIINSDESEVGEEELEKNKKNFFKLYKNLIKKFNEDTIEAKEREMKDIIVALKEQKKEFKIIYDSFIKTGGDGKGVDEGDVDGEGGKGEDGNGEGDNEVKVKGKGNKGDSSKDREDEGEGSGEVKRLEETAERLKKEAAEAKKEADRLKKDADAANLNLKEGADEEEKLILTKKALDAAVAAHDAALEASDAKKKADDADKAAATAAEEEAKKKEKEAEDAKKKAEEAAAEAKKKKDEAEEKKKDEDEAAEAKEAEDAKKKENDAAAGAPVAPGAAPVAPGAAPVAPGAAPVDEKVFNFEYNNNSCYVNSALQMLIDNDELCDKIIEVAKEKKLNEPFNGVKESNEYLLYLLNKIIKYHRENRHSIGEPKKPSYNDYIFPLREYLIITKKNEFNYGFGDAPALYTHILEILNKHIKQNYILTPLTFNDRNMDIIDLNNLIKDEINYEEIIRLYENESYENLYIQINREQQNKEASGSESSKKPITLPHSLLFNNAYKLKGFIHYISNIHFVYYKLLNSEKNVWVLLDDHDAKDDKNETINPKQDSNDTKKILHDNKNPVLGKNGEIISVDKLPNFGSVMIYYKRDDTTVLTEEQKKEAIKVLTAAKNAKKQKVDENNAENERRYNAETAAAIEASLAEQHVALATRKPFKYSFESVNDTVLNNGLNITPIYNSSAKPYLYANKMSAKFMASLNAGDEGLYVGGGFINKAFEQFLSNNDVLKKLNSVVILSDFSVRMHLSFYMKIFEIEKEANKTDAENDREHYLKKVNTKYDANIKKYSGTFHTFKGGGLVDKKEFDDNPYYAESYLYISEQQLTLFKYNEIYPGDVFIDILKYPPLNYEVNKAMIYCVGPRGSDKDAAEFINAVEIVGKNIANAIFNYNNITDKQNIDYARICLISGGDVFRHHLKTPADVAEALIKGIHSVNTTKKVKDIVYNFAYADGAFQTAFDKLKANDATLASAELIIT